MKRKPYDFIIDFLFMAALISGLFGGTLFTSGKLIYGHDITYFYPNEVVMEASGNGTNFPLWNPYFGAGAPGLGKIQVGMFYIPLMLLRSLFSAEIVLDLDAMFHLFIAGTGVYLLMRQLSVTRAAALFAAIAFMLSGSLSPRVLAGHASVLRSIAWIGWLLFAYIRLLQKQTWKLAVLTAIFVGLVIGGGHPQMSIIVLLTPLGYFFVRFLPECVRKKQWRRLRMGFYWSMGAVVLGLGITAVQIIPYFSWQNQTVRAAGDAFINLDTMVKNSFLWQHFLAFFMPTIWFDVKSSTSITLSGSAHFWENSAFTGVLTLLIIGLGMTVRSTQHQANQRFFATLAVAGLFLSMGTGVASPIYEYLYQAMPYIRAPGRFMLWWTFAMAILAGLALDTLLKQSEMSIKLSKIGTGLAISTVALLMGWWQFKNLLPDILLNSFQLSPDLIRLTQQNFTANIMLLVIKLGAIAISILLITRRKKYARYRNGLLIMGISLEMSLFAFLITPSTPLTYLYSRDSPYAHFEFQPEVYRFDGYREPPQYLIPTLVHLRNGEEGSQFWELFHTPNGKNVLSANFNITSDILNQDDWKLMQQQDGIAVYTHRNNLPRIYAAPVVQQVVDEERALRIVGDAQFSGWEKAVVIRPETVALRAQLDRLPQSVNSDNMPVFSGHFLSYRNNEFMAEVMTEQPMMVVFSEMYDKDWQAQVNGQTAVLWKTNYAFRGVLVEAGASTITMQYKSQPYRIGLAITLVTMLIIGVITIYSLYAENSGKVERDKMGDY